MQNRQDKRKVFSRRVIGLALAVGISVSATACAYKNNNSSTPTSNKLPPTTDEEIFTTVKEADKNSRAYEQAYAIEITSTEKHNDREVKMQQVASVDIEKGKFVSKSYAIDENGEKQPYEECKGFQVSGQDYWYYSDYANAKCYKANEGEALEYVLGGMPCESLALLVSFTLADSFNELTQAYEQVTATSVASLQKQSPNAVGDTQITTAYDNGVSVVQIDSRVEIPMENQTPTSYATTFSLTAKDEKISTIYVKETIEYEIQGYPSSYFSEYSIDYEYSFDEELYNSVIPCAETARTETQYVGIEFVYYKDFSVWGSVAFNENKNATELFASAEYEAFNRYVRVEGDSFDYTVEGWYLDEACTQRFETDSISSEDLLGVKKLYAKDFSVSNKWIFIAMKPERVEKRLSKPYQIVEKNGLPSATAVMDCTPCVLWANGAQRVWNIPQESFDEIYFQGQRTTETSVVLESGNIYTIEYISVYEDTDYTLFSKVMDLLSYI